MLASDVLPAYRLRPGRKESCLSRVHACGVETSDLYGKQIEACWQSVALPAHWRLQGDQACRHDCAQAEQC